MESRTKSEKVFSPLECNPDVFNVYLEKLGIQSLEFIDVYGLDPEMLQFVPRPVRAILLVFPISETYEQYIKTLNTSQYISKSHANWAKQTIPNSCGTMALIHALANGVPLDMLGNGFGAELVSTFNELCTEERPKYLEGSQLLEEIHEGVAEDGVTVLPDDLENVEFHYVCITKHKDELVELDGRREGPIVHVRGVSTQPDILQIPPTLDIIRQFIDREKDSLNFSMLALVDKWPH